MQKRKGKLLISQAGGTASKNSKTYKISIPSSWVQEMGLNENNRDVELVFENNMICIEPIKTINEFVKEKLMDKHEVKKIEFYDANKICTLIYADFTDKTLSVENYSDIVKTAFGNNDTPTWDDFQVFLKERCIPKERSGIREYLEAIGVDEYNPIEIIKKTQGRMAEDNQWIKMEDVM